jgi:hypothetical protein
MKQTIAALVFACGAAIAAGYGCASAPTAAQQAQVGLYATALQGCIAKAKLSDSGLAGYEACEKGVQQSFGYDGGQ